MNRSALTVGLILFGIATVVAYLSLFTVDQTQQALVLEFGKPKREIAEPGLHYKIPFIQNVEYFDKRILDIDTASQEVIASDQKRLVVDAFARYRITDPLLFFQSVRDERIANSRLGAILEASLRRRQSRWHATPNTPMSTRTPKTSRRPGRCSAMPGPRLHWSMSTRTAGVPAKPMAILFPGNARS